LGHHVGTVKHGSDFCPVLLAGAGGGDLFSADHGCLNGLCEADECKCGEQAADENMFYFLDHDFLFIVEF
jgi:hypothetical protein